MTYPMRGYKLDVDRIALELITRARKNRFVIYMLSVYADDSSDEKCERIFAIAGVIGTQEEWDKLEIVWKKRTKGEIFHAVDVETDKGEFKDNSHKENKKLYKDLTQIIVKSKLMGFVVAMDLEGHSVYFPDTLEDMPYYHCFERTIREFAKWGYLFIPQEKVKFTFDINHKIEYNAGRLYDFLVNLPEWRYKYSSYMDKEISFASRQKTGIQVADLYAHEVMKQLDNFIGPRKRPTRLSMQALLDTKRFIYHFYHKDYFKDFRDKFKELERKTGLSHEDYKKWLQAHKLSDNVSNRIRHLIYLESLEPTKD